MESVQYKHQKEIKNLNRRCAKVLKLRHIPVHSPEDSTTIRCCASSTLQQQASNIAADRLTFAKSIDFYRKWNNFSKHMCSPKRDLAEYPNNSIKEGTDTWFLLFKDSKTKVQSNETAYLKTTYRIHTNVTLFLKFFIEIFIVIYFLMNSTYKSRCDRRHSKSMQKYIQVYYIVTNHKSAIAYTCIRCLTISSNIHLPNNNQFCLEDSNRTLKFQVHISFTRCNHMLRT